MSNVATVTTKGFKIAPLLNDEMSIISIPNNKQSHKVKLVVTSVRDLDDNVVLAEKFPEYSHSYLINFQAVEARNIGRILDAFQIGDNFAPEEALDVIAWEHAKGMQFSHRVNVFTNNITADGEDGRPMDYDTISCTIKYATDVEGNRIHGKFDIKGLLIDEETPDNMKGDVIEVASFVVPKAAEAETMSTFLARARAKHTTSQAPEGRTEIPVNKEEEEVAEPVKAKAKA